jgi:histone deacetylase complex subunit SAP18
VNYESGGFGGLGSSVEEVKRVEEKPIDREKTCPLLLRLFYQLGRHNSPLDFTHGKTPLNELQVS